MSQNAQVGATLNPRRAPKSRNGCLRCKAKRLKCSENKPSCIQCNTKNVPCPGYKAKSLIWSTKHEKMMTSNSNSALPPSAKTLARELAGQELEKEEPSKDGATSPTDSISRPQVERMEESNQPSRSRRDSGQYTDSLSAIRQQLHESTVPEFLLPLPTMLVEYYFNYVCQIFSSFDGILNPFRSTVGKLWDGSAPIYYAIQSMAAAFLSNHFPRMSSVGVQMQRETFRCLYQVQQGGLPNPENLDKTLLTVLLVGQTTAWHNPNDLGLVHLKSAKRLNRRRLEQQVIQIDADAASRAQRQNEFFEQCILYWDMLAGFVVDDVDEFGFGKTEVENGLVNTLENSISIPCDDKEKVFPHPWTGVSPKVQKLFAEVGRLVRRYRKAMRQDAASANFLSLDLGFEIQYPSDSSAIQGMLSKAQSLEEELLSFEPPSLTKLVDAGDENTPVQQYIYLAEAYRYAALLEIYRTFSQILTKRVPLTDNGLASSSTSDLDHQTFHFLPIPNSQAPEDFLVSLALHTVSLLEKLPSNSGTRCLQPIVHIVAASELRFSSTSTNDPLSPFLPASSIFNSITSREVDIASARRFIVTRLQEFQLSLPAKPIVKALELIQETWARQDLGQEVHWMDVMEQMGWASIFG